MPQNRSLSDAVFEQNHGKLSDCAWNDANELGVEASRSKAFKLCLAERIIADRADVASAQPESITGRKCCGNLASRLETDGPYADFGVRLRKTIDDANGVHRVQSESNDVDGRVHAGINSRHG